MLAAVSASPVPPQRPPGVPRREGPRQVLGLPRRGALVEVLRVLLVPVPLVLFRRRQAPAHHRRLPSSPDPRQERAHHAAARCWPGRGRSPAAIPKSSWPLASAAGTRSEGGRECRRHGPLPRELVVGDDGGMGAGAGAVAVGGHQQFLETHGERRRWRREVELGCTRGWVRPPRRSALEAALAAADVMCCGPPRANKRMHTTHCNCAYLWRGVAIVSAGGGGRRVGQARGALLSSVPFAAGKHSEKSHNRRKLYAAGF